jgi:hypothetical protein
VTGAPPAKLVGKANIMGGTRGKAMRLDGKAYLEVMPDPRLSVEKSLTVDAWIAPEAMGETGGRIVDKVTAGKHDGFLFDTHPGNSLRLITPLGEISFEANLPEAEWVHVAATCAPTGEMKLFINGKEVAAKEGKGTVLDSSATWVSIFHRRMNEMSLENTYEARHARLIMECAAATRVRKQAQTEGKLAPLAQPESQIAADQLYVDTVMKLTTGLRQTLESYAESSDPQKKKIYTIYKEIPR